MKTSIFSVTKVLLVGILLSGCAYKTIAPGQTVELGRLAFVAPAGEGWKSTKYDSHPYDFVVFKKSGSSGSPRLGMMIWQFRADSPATSDEDLWNDTVSLYRDAADAGEGYDFHTTKCDKDRTLTKVGLICRVEGTHNTKGSFWVTDRDAGETIDTEGHVYAFVFPDDDKEIGIIEYFQEVLPGVPPADTEQLLREFAQNLTLR